MNTRNDNRIVVIGFGNSLRGDDGVFGTRATRSVDGAVLGPEAFVLRFFGGDHDDRLLLVNLGRDVVMTVAPVLTGSTKFPVKTAPGSSRIVSPGCALFSAVCRLSPFRRVVVAASTGDAASTKITRAAVRGRVGAQRLSIVNKLERNPGAGGRLFVTSYISIYYG